MSSQTKITIRHDSLLVLEVRGSRREWCDSCSAEADMVCLDITAPIPAADRATLQRCLAWGQLHGRSTPDGALLICLGSLRRLRSGQKAATAFRGADKKGGSMQNRIGLAAVAAGFTKVVNLARRMLTLSLCLGLLAVAASAAPQVYVVTSNQQFGVVDLGTGTFRQIGPNTPEGQANLVWGPDGSLLSLTYSGNLEKINPVTGQTTVVGQTGLSFNAFDLAEVAGKLYATDFANDLYSVDPNTGAATLIRATIMPSDPAPPFSGNPINLCAESLYGVGGAMYATFYAFTLDPNSLAESPVVPPAIYRIDPKSGAATFVANTATDLGATVMDNGTFYAFKWLVNGFTQFGPQIQSAVVTLDLSNGATRFVSRVDPAAGGILGAAPAGALRWRALTQ